MSKQITVGGEEVSSKINCQRCKIESAVVHSRKENFCKGCFTKFIRGKQRKSMMDEKFKVVYPKNGAEQPPPHRILLCVSFGLSSLVLLDVMISLLQEQIDFHKGKQGFELICFNISEFDLKLLQSKANSVFKQLQNFYSPIKFSYKVLDLKTFVADQTILNIFKTDKAFDTYISEFKPEAQFSISDLLSRCPSKSTKEDLLQIIYHQLILQTAYKEGCDTILLGHSMTRIANEIIALTVKGRGSAIHDSISDRFETYRNKPFNIIYPLRDVLHLEIEKYGELAIIKQFEIGSNMKKETITKNMTISTLVTNYFNNLESTGYASVASTVVKTGDKLGNPTFESVASCEICGTPIYKDPKSWLRNITVKEPADLVTEEENKYLQDYLESLRRVVHDGSSGTTANLAVVCYGCMGTTVNGLAWPKRNLKEDILNEYVLTDDED